MYPRCYCHHRILPGLIRGARGIMLGHALTNYQSAIDILNRYQSQRRYPLHPTSKTPRERTESWLRLLGCDITCTPLPKIIHVAGTKGKGTTCSYCNAILVKHQKLTGIPKKIGCLTSPHQMDVRERIMINNEKISKSLFSYYVKKLDADIDQLTSQADCVTPPLPGYPGFLSLLGLYIFILEKVDVAIVETGMGGERDSTNIFPHPIATGITTIGLDHVNVLGHSLEEIAWHKAGIFKSGSPAFTVSQEEVVMEVLEQRAKEKHSAGLEVLTDQNVIQYHVKVSPDKRYQRLNASLAIALADTYLRAEDRNFSMTDDIARGLEDAVLLGRCQVVKDKDVTWFISVAHNKDSLRETVSWFKGCVITSHAPRVLVFNSPRDPRHLLKILYEGLLPIMPQGVVFCTDQLDEVGKIKPDLIDLRRDRTLIKSLQTQKENSRIWKEFGGVNDVEVVHTIMDAMKLVRGKYKGAEVLVTGSSYLAGNVLYALHSQHNLN